MVFGSDLLEIPKRAVGVAKALSVQLVIPSGGRGRLTPPDWITEAERFAEVFWQEAPAIRVHPEPHARTTHENAKFGWKIFRDALGASSTLVVMQIPIQSLRARKMLEFVIDASGLSEGERPVIISHSAFETSLDHPLPGWPVSFWRQRQLFEAFGEIGGLLAWQNPVDGNIARTLIPFSLLDDALLVARFLLDDPSITDEEKGKIRSRGIATILLHRDTPPDWSPVVQRSQTLRRSA